jgi:hypothetical protein
MRPSPRCNGANSRERSRHWGTARLDPPHRLRGSNRVVVDSDARLGVADPFRLGANLKVPDGIVCGGARPSGHRMRRGARLEERRSNRQEKTR